MQVILTKEVLGLGDPGQIVKVKPGYGRNYLIPQGMAIEATKKNLSQVEAEKTRLEAQLVRDAEKVKSEAEGISGVSLTLTAKSGEAGKLFGSVTNMDLAKALAEAGFDIDRRRILLEAPIKQLGTHDFKIKLHPHVVVDLSVTVEPEAGDEPAPAEKPQEAQAEAEDAEAVEAEAVEAQAGEEAPAEDETPAEDEAEPKQEDPGA